MKKITVNTIIALALGSIHLAERTPISIRFSMLRRDLHQDNGETLFGKTGSLMWMDYKNYLEEYDNKHFPVLDAYM